jgi:catechol 2,3-dioxygenase-like lactoylglutathione lyase family enzyme
MTSRRTPGRYSVTIIPRKIGAITLFVDDLQRARSFYLDVFGGPVVYQDENSAVFDFGGTVINLLDARAAGDLVEPGTGRGAGSRFVLSIWVDDVDAIVIDLQRRGVALFSGPIDRDWGKRTASFTDPDGHIWEIAQDIPSRTGG